MKTLVVEDTRISLKLVCHHLERMGITPIPAENGTRAVELFIDEQPDMVLLDIVLPDIDGFEVARRIRAAEKPGDWTPILFLTSMTDDEALEQGIAAGGDDYLYKPISEIVLGAKIRAMQRIIQMRNSLLVMTRKLDIANRELRRLTSLDGLTGIANRRHFQETLEREWRRSMRHGTEFSLLMCDVDRFKAFNDNLGHQAGDDCLRRVAGTLAATVVRGGDFVARYGGEEFAVILPETPLAGALVVAERMRSAIHALDIAHPQGEGGRLTMSFGATSGVAMPEAAATDLVKLADKALYQAKNEGRDRVCALSSMDLTETELPQ
ncbi:diguanylate cyclase [Azospira restricta]|uniref:diguanylate cyclase n=1 Tax=Azospira restricta TaxID=404405 RepID=A0A974SMP8_9RHOO|nr:diguanylate cyclase [Azospira restricta]QRJ62875.1 diguanylate cyclase [Azospira restricta]